MLPPGLVLGIVLVGLSASASLAQATQPPRSGSQMLTVAGFIESITFPEYDITLDAKLDTGADFSSLGVTGLDRFKRNGKIWYRFTLTGEDGKTATIEQQTNRIARVMRAEVKDTRRPIIRLIICLAGHVAETDFTLTDRSEQQTPVLIGRRFLVSRILVDSGHTHLFPKRCESGK
jgi:hypothetical protein